MVLACLNVVQRRHLSKEFVVLILLRVHQCIYVVGTIFLNPFERELSNVRNVTTLQFFFNSIHENVILVLRLSMNQLEHLLNKAMALEQFPRSNWHIERVAMDMIVFISSWLLYSRIVLCLHLHPLSSTQCLLIRRSSSTWSFLWYFFLLFFHLFLLCLALALALVLALLLLVVAILILIALNQLGTWVFIVSCLLALHLLECLGVVFKQTMLIRLSTFIFLLNILIFRSPRHGEQLLFIKQVLFTPRILELNCNVLRIVADAASIRL